MSIFVDIAIVTIIILSTFLGYKKGLIGVAFKIISFFIAIILSFVLCSPVSNYIIQNTTIDDQIQTKIQETLSKEETTEGEENNKQNMPEIITDYIQEEVTKATTQAQNQVANVVAQNVTSTIINAISFICIFIILKIVLMFLKIFSEQLAKLPIIKQFNKFGGTVYGILRGFFMIYFILGILSFLSPMITDTTILSTINSSFLGNIFYNNNLLVKIFFT